MCRQSVKCARESKNTLTRPKEKKKRHDPRILHSVKQSVMGEQKRKLFSDMQGLFVTFHDYKMLITDLYFISIYAANTGDI